MSTPAFSARPEERASWRISPSFRLWGPVDNHLRIELAEDPGQWFWLSTRLLSDFIDACAKLRRKERRYRSMPEAERRKPWRWRYPVADEFVLTYAPSDEEILVFCEGRNDGRPVLRFAAWELAALVGGVVAAFGDLTTIPDGEAR